MMETLEAEQLYMKYNRLYELHPEETRYVVMLWGSEKNVPWEGVEETIHTNKEKSQDIYKALRTLKRHGAQNHDLS